MVYGPPGVVLRLTLYVAAPTTAFQLRMTVESPTCAANPVGAVSDCGVADASFELPLVPKPFVAVTT